MNGLVEMLSREICLIINFYKFERTQFRTIHSEAKDRRGKTMSCRITHQGQIIDQYWHAQGIQHWKFEFHHKENMLPHIGICESVPLGRVK